MLKKSLITILCMLLTGIFAGSALAQTATENTEHPGPNVSPLTALSPNALAQMKPNGEVVIYLSAGKGWKKAGSLGYDKYLRERKIDLSKFISGTKPVKLKLIQKGGGSAHLDAVILGTKLPLTVNGSKGLPLKKLTKKDNDLINLEKQGVELTFPATGKQKTMTIAARVESVKISQTPFQFPLRNLYRKMDVNSEFYTYKLNSTRETLKLGSMQKVTSAQKPFYREYVTPESGHPPGFIYGWVRNDDQNLYVAQEFTPDNTMDGDKDYAKVYVKTGQGLREFKVSLPETKWGKSSFIYTDKVAYQHKFYEFVIPLKELGLENGIQDKDISIAFAGYGTMSAGEYYPSVSYDPVNKCYLVVYTFSNYQNGGIYGQFVSANGTQVGNSFRISASGYYYYKSVVAYDSQNARFLVVWQDDRYETEEIYGRFVDIKGPSAQGEFVISDSDYAGKPALAYDQQHGKFLIVWEDYRTVGGQIYGRVVDANDITANPNGTIANPSFVISNDPGSYYKNNPTLVFDDSNNRFLVAWEDLSAAGYNIKYQLVDPQNPPTGASLSVAASAGTCRYSPSVAYNSQQGQFLLTWTEVNVNEDVYGRLLNANGTASGDILVIAGDSTNQSKPAVVYDSVTGKYFVEWVGYDGNNQIYGQSVRPDGVLDGASSVVSTRNLNLSVNRPGLVLNTQGPNFLTVYEATYIGVGFYSEIALDVIITPDQALYVTGAFTDANLLAAIRSAISKPSGPIKVTDMAYLTSLDASGSGITNLSGLEYANNLQQLWLNNNGIDDLTPISHLTKLQQLYLSDNQITGLEALEDLTKLKGLYLGGNQISDISFLTGLNGLQELWLYDNNVPNQSLDLNALSSLTNLEVLGLQSDGITDLTPLTGLTKLQSLNLNNNQISNLTPLAGLTNLHGLYLGNNQIDDLKPLVINILKGGLGNGNYLDINNNLLDLTAGSQTSIDLQRLKGSGINVFDQIDQIHRIPG